MKASLGLVAALLGHCSAWQQPLRFHTQARHSRHSTLRSASAASDDDTAEGGETPGFVILSRPFSLTDMLMQRTIQTQKHYYAELHNEPLSAWLGDFLGHSHLDRGSTWHSCVGMRTGLQDYLETLVSTEDVTFTVKYGFGIGGLDSAAA